MAEVSGSFAPCPYSALAGRHDDENVICLRRHAVNTSNLVMKAERVVSKNPGFFSRFTKDSNVDPTEVSQKGG